MDGNALLTKALRTLQKNTNVASEQLTAAAQVDNELRHDYTLSLKKCGTTQTYNVFIKQRPSLTQLALLMQNNEPRTEAVNDEAKQYSEEKTLLVADYINTTLAQFLKDNKCDFIDSVGNAHLNFGSVFIYIAGQKPPKAPAEAKPSRAFQSTGLKLIFNLLCYPEDILSRSYRDLSQICGVSLGSIGWVFNDLKAAGYVSSTQSNQRQWLDKEGLIKRWVVAYAERLRPKLILGYYKSLHENWQDNMNISDFDAFWGGERAADKLTRYLKPELSTIYTKDSLGKLVLMNGLKEVSNKGDANVEILHKFWHFNETKHSDLVPPLLIYADLIASGDTRNLEAARIIHKELLNVRN